MKYIEYSVKNLILISNTAYNKTTNFIQCTNKTSFPFLTDWMLKKPEQVQFRYQYYLYYVLMFSSTTYNSMFRSSFPQFLLQIVLSLLAFYYILWQQGLVFSWDHLLSVQNAGFADERKYTTNILYDSAFQCTDLSYHITDCLNPFNDNTISSEETINISSMVQNILFNSKLTGDESALKSNWKRCNQWKECITSKTTSHYMTCLYF